MQISTSVRLAIIGVGVIDADIDECQPGNDCVEHANCVNTVGTYRCECEAGYRGNGKIECAGKRPSIIMFTAQHAQYGGKCRTYFNRCFGSI